MTPRELYRRVDAQKAEEDRQKRRRAFELSNLVAALRTDTFKDPSELFDRLVANADTRGPSAGQTRLLDASRGRAETAKRRTKTKHGGSSGDPTRQGSR